MIIEKQHERLRVVKGFAFRAHDPEVLAAVKVFLENGDTDALPAPYRRADGDYSIYLDPPPRRERAARRWLQSPCCGAAVVVAVPVVAHLRVDADGRWDSKLLDTMADLARQAEGVEDPDRSEAYCVRCGELVP